MRILAVALLHHVRIATCLTNGSIRHQPLRGGGHVARYMASDHRRHDESLPPPSTYTRRNVLIPAIAFGFAAADTAMVSHSVHAAIASDSVPSMIPTSQAESLSLEPGLLEARVTENVLSPPTYGMEGTDILYPAWFAGVWQVKSLTKRVEAPCGVALFGGNNTYQSAKEEIGSLLSYESRFLKFDDSVIADREYNVKSIAKAALGENSVVDIPMASPNRLTCILAPKGAPSLLQVDLITLNRRQETLSPNRFDCSEVVREIVSPLDNSNKPRNNPAITATSPILKEIETTSMYTYNEAKDEITCTQRSAVFLLPSQQNPLAMKMWEASRGRPVDVRFYDVSYARRTSL
ncbi:hypothetical protein ACA910_011050 [Epithemia clementina (nom. ined.)]